MTEALHSDVLIVGGGTAGWLAAAVLSRLLGGDARTFHLLESDQIGTVGVGEATLPPIRDVNYLLGVQEAEFLKATHATYKLGIRFDGWGEPNSSYMHSFGVHGRGVNHVGFHHYWLEARARGLELPAFYRFALAGLLAEQGRFSHPEPALAKRHHYSYAYHLDATAYARFLRQRSEAQGVVRHEGKVRAVKLDPQSGAIAEVVREDGCRHTAKLYLDCTGFRALLIGEALAVSYRDWSHWLPCNRALAAPTTENQAIPPFTVATAKSAGWQWRIPLQNRLGNGLVYASDFIPDATAQDIFASACGQAPSGDVRQLQFTAGCRAATWQKNCVAIGLASGFIEPLESTSIQLIQAAIYKLVELFPCGDDPHLEREAFNRFMTNEYEKIRDFIILHYKLNRRGDTEFWRYCANMEIPDTLARRMELFQQTGHVEEYEQGSFAEPSWLAVYLGQSFLPRQRHPVVSRLPDSELHAVCLQIGSEVMAQAEQAPDHGATLRHVLEGRKRTADRPGVGLYGQ